MTFSFSQLDTEFSWYFQLDTSTLFSTFMNLVTYSSFHHFSISSTPAFRSFSYEMKLKFVFTADKFFIFPVLYCVTFLCYFDVFVFQQTGVRERCNRQFLNLSSPIFPSFLTLSYHLNKTRRYMWQKGS